MLSSLFRSWKANRDAAHVFRDPVIGPVMQYAKDVLTDTTQGIGRQWSEDGKLKIANNLLRDVMGVLAKPDPVLAVRMRTIEFMLMTAQLDVLLLTPPTPYPSVSGELKPYIPVLVTKDRDLISLVADMADNQTADDYCDTVLMRYWVMHLNMSAYNILRIKLGDSSDNRKRDWFRPCYASLCIWYENGYRAALGMPSVIPGDSPDIRALMHSTWMNRVEEGHPNLREVWERKWTETFDEPSPFAETDI